MALKLLSLRSLRYFTKYRECSSFPSQLQYEKAANETLDKISDYLDVLPESLPVDSAYDVTNAMGVVTAVISKDIGTYVINKQSPNKQIWLSSPLSGPKRYDLTQDHRWIYTHDQEHLDVLLTREFRKIFKTDSLDFSEHHRTLEGQKSDDSASLKQFSHERLDPSPSLMSLCFLKIFEIYLGPRIIQRPAAKIAIFNW